MRVAAFLGIVGQELCRYIFHPTYLLKDATSLNDTLDTLAEFDPDLESYLRSVLFAVSLSGVDEDDPVDLFCIKAVFETLHTRLSRLVAHPKDKVKQTQFKTDLQGFCNKACKEWSFMQKLQQRVFFSLGSSTETKLKYKWQPLGFESPPLPTANQKQRVNGNASGQGFPKNSQSAGLKNQGDTAANLIQGVAVWPVFYSLDVESPGKVETLAKGFILPPAAIKAAEQEDQELLEQKIAQEQKAGNSPGSSHARLNRSMRRESMIARNGQDFLSNGSGGGGKGA